jgi:hypothetical protein
MIIETEAIGEIVEEKTSIIPNHRNQSDGLFYIFGEGLL